MDTQVTSNDQTTEPQQGFASHARNVVASALIYFGEGLLGLYQKLKPAYPAVIPIFTCLLSIPFLMFFSLGAGFTVWRSVPKGWQVPVYLQYGDGVPPYAVFPLPPMSTSAPYDITFHATVPATNANYALGNFMAELTLSTTGNTTVVSARRPALVLPLTPGIMSFIFRSPSMQDFSIPLLSEFQPTSSFLVARLEIGRRDGWRGLGNGEGRELSVYSAVIRGEVRPKGLRRILSKFPISVSAVSALTFFTTSLIVVTCCTIPSIKYNLDTSEEAEFPTPRRPSNTHSRRRASDAFLRRLSVSRRDPPVIEQTITEETNPPRSPHVYPTPEPESQPSVRRRVRIHSSPQSSGGEIDGGSSE